MPGNFPNILAMLIAIFFLGSRSLCDGVAGGT